jgi:hypothetical protein
MFTLLQAKMDQQGAQLGVGVCECFAYQSAELVVLANGSRYEVNSNTVFPSSNGPSILSEYCHIATQPIFDTHSYL